MCFAFWLSTVPGMKRMFVRLGRLLPRKDIFRGLAKEPAIRLHVASIIFAAVILWIGGVVVLYRYSQNRPQSIQGGNQVVESAPGNTGTNDEQKSVDVDGKAVNNQGSSPGTGLLRASLLVDGRHDTEGELYRTESGLSSRVVRIVLAVQGVELSSCELLDQVVVDDLDQNRVKSQYQPLEYQEIALEDGLHEISVVCGEVARDSVLIRVVDGKPERCEGFEYSETNWIEADVAELQAALSGSWSGCVETPWMPMYWVNLTVDSEGVHTANAPEVIDGQEANAMYYGSEIANPAKRMRIKSVNEQGSADGSLVIVFEPGNEVEGAVRNVQISDEQLRFNFYHMNRYGPITYRLWRR